MSVAYSQDLRDRVMAARDRGMATKEVADLFHVSPAWVRRVMQRRREHGQLSPRSRGGITVVKIDLDRLRQLVHDQPDATVKELHARLNISCSISAVDMALRRLGFSFKKRRFTLRNRTAPMSLKNARHGATGSRHKIRDD